MLRLLVQRNKSRRLPLDVRYSRGWLQPIEGLFGLVGWLVLIGWPKISPGAAFLVCSHAVFGDQF